MLYLPLRPVKTNVADSAGRILFSLDSEEDAAKVAIAVNSHADLLAACEALVAQYYLTWDDPSKSIAIQAGVAAIRKAKGE